MSPRTGPSRPRISAVRIRVLGAYGGSTPWHRQTSFLLDGTVSLDAGALTQSLTLEEQSRVRSIMALSRARRLLMFSDTPIAAASFTMSLASPSTSASAGVGV